MSQIALAAEAAVERARRYGTPTRILLKPDGDLTLANGKQYAPRMLVAVTIGFYTQDCPIDWICEDIRYAMAERIKDFLATCPHCGQTQ